MIWGRNCLKLAVWQQCVNYCHVLMLARAEILKLYFVSNPQRTLCLVTYIAIPNSENRYSEDVEKF